MKFSRETLQAIRDRIDMVELVNGYTRLERRGNRWWGLSPFKPEKTPSFSVKPEDGFYYCFATNQGGDLFRFVSEMEGLSFPEAVEFLAERAGITIDAGGGPDPEEQRRVALRELYNRVSGSFHYLLTSDERGAAARAYARQRGITDESLERFRLGYAPDDGRWLYGFLQRKSYSRGFLDESGLFSQRMAGLTLFRNRLMFPISDERDRVLAFGGRALDENARAKYINSPETAIYTKKRSLFGLSQALSALRSEKRAYLMEGYLDVIAFSQAGLSNAVAPLGTAFTAEQATLLKRWVREVVLVFDADRAGIEATFKAAVTAEKAGLRCLSVRMAPGSDPADLWLAGGTAALQELVADLRPVEEFMIDVLAGERGSDSPDELLLQRMFPYISIVNSEVRKEQLTEMLADAMAVSVGAVRTDLERWQRGEQPRRFEREQPHQSSFSSGRDVALMLATAQDGELFAYLRSKIGRDDLNDQVARHLFVLLEDAFRHQDPFPRGLVDRLDDEDLRNAVLEKLTSGEYEGWTREDVTRAVGELKKVSLERAAREIDAALRRVSVDQPEEMRRLLEEKMAINHELEELKVRADD